MKTHSESRSGTTLTGSLQTSRPKGADWAALDWMALGPVYAGFATPDQQSVDRFHVFHLTERIQIESWPACETLVVRECCSNIALMPERRNPAELSRGIEWMILTPPLKYSDVFWSELPWHLRGFLRQAGGNTAHHVADQLTTLGKIPDDMHPLLCALEAGRMMDVAVRITSSEANAAHANPRCASPARLVA